MKISDLVHLLDCEVLCSGDHMERELHSACGSDMMSEVLAFVKDESALLTGLINIQVIRTAEMMDILCIVFVRGKMPDPSIIDAAKEKGITLLATKHRMYTACGILYSNGLQGGNTI